MENQGEIVLYQLDKEVKLEVRLENERCGFQLMRCHSYLVVI